MRHVLLKSGALTSICRRGAEDPDCERTWERRFLREKCGASALVSLCHFRRDLPLTSYTFNLKRFPFKLKNDLAFYSISFFFSLHQKQKTKPACTEARTYLQYKFLLESAAVRAAAHDLEVTAAGRVLQRAVFRRLGSGCKNGYIWRIDSDHFRLWAKSKLLRAAFPGHFLWQHAVRVISIATRCMSTSYSGA